MPIWTCSTCGIEHPDTDRPPATCAICADERQYVPEGGQTWTTQEQLRAEGHRTRVEELEPDLYALRVEPELAIGQRGLLVRSAAGNLLWEPPGYLDDDAVRAVRGLGGLAAVSASHPHLVGASVSWSRAFGGVPVLVASADRSWVRRPDPVIELWSGTRQVLPGITLVQCGGHFAGSAVAHWAAGAGGRGVLLTGDTLAIGADRASVNVMRSYVNNIPLPERAVRRILAAVEPLPYDHLYGAFRTLGAPARDRSWPPRWSGTSPGCAGTCPTRPTSDRSTARRGHPGPLTRRSLWAGRRVSARLRRRRRPMCRSGGCDGGGSGTTCGHTATPQGVARAPRERSPWHVTLSPARCTTSDWPPGSVAR